MNNASTRRDGSTRQVNSRGGNHVRQAVLRWFESLEERRMMALVATDQADYHYGETALISGADFAANEPVQLQITHAAGTPGSNEDPQNQAFEVQTDAAGKFTTTWVVNDPDALGATYVLTATGAAGETAQATFTDSIANPVTIATAISSTSGTSFQSATFSAAVPVGNTVIVTLAMDPNSGTVSISDGKGNTYTKDADVSNGSGTSGVRTLIFSGPVTTALTTSDRITVTFGTATVAKVISVQSASGLLSASIKDQSSTGNGSTGTPNSGTTGATAQPDELLIAAIGIEDKNTPTAGSGYTGLTGTNTTGGSSDTNIGLLPEYRIVSATGTYSATSSAVTVPWAAALVTYKVNVPSVVSINRASSTPTGASSVSWTVTFSKSVTGVDSGDFSLVSTGAVSGASITSVTGGGTTWTVTANTGSGDGSLGLNLVDNDSIKDSSNNNPLGGTGAGNGNFTGQVYTVDKANPSVASIVLANASPTNASSVTWTVTFSENVTGVDSSDFALMTTGGVSGASITGVSGSGLTYTVTANTGSGEGTIGLNLIDNDSVIDQGSNPLGGAGANNGNFTGPVYTFDKTAPSVTINQNSADPTNVSPIHFTVVFSEAVTGFTASDVVLSGTANPTTATVTGSGTTYDVAVSGMSANGTVIASIVTGAAQDSAGNLSLAVTSPDNTVTYDTIAPAAPVFTGIVLDTGSSASDNITSDPSLVLNGTAEANSLITITRVGTGVIGTTTTNGLGIWSFDYTGTSLADGAHSFTATAKDAAGNTSGSSLTLSVTIDTAAPAAPAITGVVNDTGSSSSDQLTNDQSLILSGTAEANSVVAITRVGTGLIGTTTANGSGIWSFDYTGTTLAEGSYSFTATATDVAGNLSAASGTFNVTIDLTAPAAPAITGIATDTGSSSTDRITNDPTLILSGTAEANSIVTLTRVGTGVIGTATSNGSGNWSFDYTGTTLAGGAYNFTATATDAAGNASPASAAFGITIDVTAPAAPAITGIATDTGASLSDRITNDQTLILSGIAEANSTVTITRVGTGVIGAALSDGSGNWSFDYTGTTLAAGTHSFTATATDVAGNVSASSVTFTVTIDLTAPAAPAITGIATDTGSSSSDHMTNDQTLVLSGTAEAGSIVTITRVGTGVIGTATANGVGAWSFDYTGTTLVEGTHSFTVTATDAAGNLSADSGTFAVTIDLTVPNAPAITGIISDTGSSASDAITSDTTLILNGIAEANGTVTITRLGTGVIGTTTANGSGAWSFDYTGTILAAGNYSFTATATDAAGNISATSGTFAVVIDSTAPAVPAITGIATDTGSSATDRVTNDQTLVLSGTAEANSVVTITRAGTGIIGTATANGAGAWSFDYTGTLLAEGSHSFTATATDAAGNVSASSGTFGVTIDLTAPNAPAITTIVTDTGSSSADKITSDQTLVLSGTAEANSTVTITRVGVGAIGTATADGSGNWSFDYTGTTLPAGVHQFTATATDAAGNTSPASSTLSVTIDLAAPASPAFSGISTDTGSSSSDAVTSDTTLVLLGTAEANSTVTVTRVGTGVLGTTTTDGSGNWSFDYTGTTLTAGTYSFTATAKDAAGNTSGSSATFSVTVDNAAPAAPAITGIASDTGPSATDRITNDQTLVLSGTAEANSTVTITRVSIGVIGTTTADGSGNWGFDYTGTTLAEGSYTFTATATDAAGNISAASGAFGVTVDLTAPNAPVITSFATDSGTLGDFVTSDNTLAISGTAENNSTVSVFDGATLLGTTTASGAGAWTFTTAVLSDGTHSFTAKATDTAGNISAASSVLTVKVDTAAPNAPSQPDLADSSDTGGSQTDNQTFVTTPLFTGTAEANSTVTIFDGSTALGTTTADSSGNWSFLTPDVKALSSTPGGSIHVITAKAADAAGNVSASSASLAITVADQGKLGSVAVTNQAPKPVNPGGIAAYDLTLTRGDQKNSGGNLNIDLTVNWPGGVPIGVSILGPVGSHAVTLRSGQPVTTLIFRIATSASTPVGIYPFTITAGAASGTVVGIGLLVVGFGADQGPNANNDTASTTRNTPVNINVVSNDVSGSLGSAFTVTSFTSGSNGIVSNLGGGVLKYTPVTNFTGTDTFTYTVTDGNGLTDTALVTVFVDAGNIAPVAVADNYSTNENTPLTISAPGVLANDSDPNGDSIVAHLDPSGGPTHGTLTLNANGSFTYTPAAGFSGTDSFIYYADDGSFNSNEVLVTITVGAVNDAPVNAVPGPQSVNEDTALVFSSGNGNAISISDPDADPNSVRVTLSVTNGTLTLSGILGLTFNSGTNGSGAMTVTGTMASINAALNGLTYNPGANFNGPVTLSITTNDLGNTGSGGALSDIDTVAITVSPVNDPPVASNQTVNTNEDTAVSITLVATDIDSASLMYSIVSGPLHGVLLQTSSGVYTYTPNANYNGTDTFTFKANDGSLDSNVATVTVNVLPVNDAPTVSGTLAITNQHTPVTVTLSGADIDGDALTFKITTLPSSGSLYAGNSTLGHLITAGDISGGGYALSGAQVTYLPGGEFFGSDAFSFVSFDGQATSAPANASITVNDITPPAIVVGGSTGSENDGQTQAFSWSVSDPSGLGSVLVTVKHDNVTVFTSASAIGSVNFDSLGLGLFEIIVDATDTAGNSSSASRSVTVSDDDTAGPIVDLSGSTGSETDAQTQNFGWNITDASGLAGLNVTITRNGDVVYSTSSVADATGNFNFDSLGLGTYEMTVSATDTDSDRASDSLTTIATRTVTVTDDDTAAPVITLGGSTTAENDGQDQVFTWSVTDAGSGIGSVSVSITKDGVEIFISTNATGSFDFNSYGLGTFQISASATDADNDRAGDALSSSATRSVVVSDDDTIAPVITLGGSDATETDAQDQVFTWDVSDTGSGLGSVSVNVTKDGIEIFGSTNASGSFDFNSYGLGVYAIHVSATDADADRASDSLSSSASRTVTVSDDDTAGPVIVLGGSEGSENDGQNQLFTWDISDAGSGLGSVSVTITQDGQAIFTSSDAIGSFDFNSYGLGTFAISVSASDADSDRASDALTSSASRSVTVGDDDTTPPLIVLGGSENSENDGQDQIFTWDVSDSGSGVGSNLVSVSRDGVEVFNSADLSGSFDFNSYGLGTYTISVSATDADADRADDALSSSASRTVVVSDDDTAAPIITLGGSTGSEVDGQNQAFTWNVTDAGSGLGPVSVSVIRDGVEIFTSSDSSGSFDFNSQGLGTYEINVSATDADGDRLDDSLTSSASRSVTVSDDDTTPPLIVLGGSENGENDGQDQAFTWNVSDAGSGVGSATVSITKDGVEIFSSSDPAGSFDFNAYGLGTYSISVSATDADSDRVSDALTSTASRSVIVSDDDTAAPVITLGGSEGAENDGQDQVFTWNVGDAGSGFGSVAVSITKNGNEIFSSTDASGSFDFNSLGLGTYEISVSATDADGDRLNDALTSSASQSVTVTDDDTAAPVITLGGSANSENDGQDQAFTWDVTDAGSGVSNVTVTITQDDAIIYTSNDLSGSFDFNGYGLGTFQISVSASDADADRAGDSLTSSASRTVVVSDDDTTPPAIVLSGSEANENDGQDQVFTWDVTDAGSGVGSVTVTITKDGLTIATSNDLAGSFDFNSYGLGTFAISVSATDADADRSSDALTSTASRSVVVSDDDTTGPSIVIGGSHGAENDGQDQVFTWNVTDTGSGVGSVSVSVTKDGVEIFTSTDLAGSFDFNALGLGAYSISVTATDADADRADDAITTSNTVNTVVVDDDTTPPVVVLGGSSGTENDGQDQNFTWSASDSESGLENVAVSITRDGTEIYNSSDASGSFDFNLLGLGTYTMTVTATDADADRADDAMITLATRTVTVTDDDTTAPVIALGGSAGIETDGNDQSFTWHVTDAGSGISSVLVSITKDGVEIYNSTDADGSFDFNSYGLGTFEMNVTATDGDVDRPGDALSSASTRAVIVGDDDVTPPVITLGGSSGSETDGQDQIFTWNVGDVGSSLGSVSVSITRNGLEIFNSSDAAGSFDFNSYGLGTYTISVSATDADSDRVNDSLSSATSRSVEVSDDDVAAPIITLGGSLGDETDGNNQAFSWNIEDAGSGIGSVTVSITRDGVEIFNSSDASGSFDFNSYGLGSFAINVTATDADNDRLNDALTATASRSVTVADDDAAAPIITLGGSDASENDGQDQVFTWDVTDGGSGLGSASVVITRDGVEILNSSDAAGSFDFNSYGLGAYEISVTATDADSDRADDALTAVASRSVIVSDDDTAPPVITLGGSEGSENDGQDQVFTWTITDAGSGIGSVSVIVTRDGLPVFTSSDLAGSFDFNSLGLGTYAITVEATDADSDRAGDALSSTATRSAMVSDDDTAAPIITLGGSETSENDGQDQVFTWSVEDAGSGIGSVSVIVTRNGESVYTSTSVSGSFDFNALGLGDYQISVTATDADSDRVDDSLTSTASRSVSVSDDDIAPPIITLGGSAGSETDGSDQQFTWDIVDAGSGIGFVAVTITRDGDVVFSSTDASGSFDFNSYGLGTYKIVATATDADSDRADDALTSNASRTVIVSDDDIAAPVIALGGSEGAENDGQDQLFTWNVTDAGSGLGSVSVIITKDSVEIFNSSDASGSFDFNSYGLGTYQINVSATDADGDRLDDSLSSNASRSVVVGDDDVTAPVIALGGSDGGETDGQDQVFTWNVTDSGSGVGSAAVSITRDGIEIYNSTNPSGNFDFNSYGLGTYQISVSATDADSDRADDALTSSASRTVVVGDDDVTAPVIVLGGSDGAETDGQNQTFTWDVSDAGSGLGSVSVSITKDGVEILSSTDTAGTFDFNSLGLGTYAINVTATDADGDRLNDSLTATASRTVVVGDDDTAAPVIALGGSEDAENDGQNQAFTWNVSDAGSGVGSVILTVTRDGVQIFSTTDLSGTFDFNSYGLGTYAMSVSATDADADRTGDALTATATRTVVVSDDDTTAPVIDLGGSEGSETDGDSQHFTWNVSDTGSGLGSVGVSVTKNGIEIFSSTDASGSFDFNSYGLGAYAINVTATDADGDRLDDALTSSASRTVVVSDDDTAAPVINLGGSTGDETDGQDQVLTWNVADAGSGVGSVTVSITQDGVEIFSSTDLAGSFDFNSYGLGEFQIHVTATDADNDRASDALTSIASRTVVVTDDDVTAPVIALGGSTGGETDADNQHFTWNVTDAGSGVGGVSVSITRDGVEIFTSTEASGSFNFDTYGLGAYAISVAATDADSDRTGDAMTATASRSVVVADDDVTPPVIVLSGSEGDENDGQTQAFSWNISDGGSGLSAIEITITRDDGTGPVVVYQTTDLANTVGSFNFDSLGLGTYTISASAIDADGDRAGDTLASNGVRVVTVTDDDTTPPTITIGGSTGSETDGDNQVFTWDVADAGSGLSSVNVTITRDGATIFTSGNASGSFDFNSYGLGMYEISVSAIDGDADRPGDATADGHLSAVVVGDDDVIAPEIVLGGSEGSETDGQNQNFSWNASDLGSGLGSVNVVITRDGEIVYTGAAPSGNFDFNSLGLGTYTITVNADDADSDRAGDSLSASASRTVVVSDDDTTAPIITLGGSNGSETDGQDQTFTWTVTDAGSGVGSVTVSVTKNGVEIFNSTELSGSFDFNSYGLGAFAISVSATDADSDRVNDALTSSASQSVLVSDDDVTPPVITLGGSDGSETDAQDQVFTWNITDAGSGIGSVSVSVTRDGVEIFTSSAVAGTFDFNSYGLGTYAINVTAIDADDDRSADSLTSVASSNVIVSDDDTASPTISFGGSTDNETDGLGQSFTWDISDTGSGLSQVSIIITRDDGTGPVVIYSSNTLSDATGSFNFDSHGLGTYQISVVAVDADNDRLGDTLISTASRTVIVSDDDTTPPAITLGGSTGSENDGQNQAFTWNVSDAGSGIGSVTVSITRNGVEIFSSSDATGAFDFNSYGPGSYQMHVSATDADSDRANDALSTTDSRSVIVSDDDTDAPLISLGGSTGVETDGQNQHFTWNASDAASDLSDVSVVITRDDGTGPVVIYSSNNLADASGNFDFNSYGLGTYTMTVSATDADSDFAADALSASASRTVVVGDDDTDAPVILISGSTGSENDGQDQSFTWSVVDAGSGLGSISITITRDDGTGPVAVFQSTDLADADGSFDFNSYGLGTYKISITATDADSDRAGDAMTGSASRTVVVSDDDTTPPAIFVGGSTGNENDGQNQVFTWDVSDAGSGVGSVTISITRDGVVVHSSTDVTGSFDFNSLGLGTYAINVSATDADSDRTGDALTSTVSRSVIVVDDDADAPVVSITGSSGAQTDGDNQVFNWNVADAGSGIGSVSVVVKKFGITVFSSTSATGSFDFNSLGVGSYSICVTATDADNDRAGDSLTTIAKSAVSVVDDDATPPLIVLGGSSASETDGQNQIFTWNVTDTGSGIGSVGMTVKRNGVAIYNSTSASGSFDFNSYGLGTYLICVTATDADNDRANDSLTSTASLSTVVSDDDTAAPIITLGGSTGLETDGQDQSFNWSASDLASGLDNVDVTVTRDGALVYSSSDASGAFDFNSLGLGTYAITVLATDADHDRADDSMTSSATRTVVVSDDDITAPVITVGGSAGAEHDGQDQTFTWDVTDAGSGIGAVNVSVLRDGVEIFSSTAASGTFDFNAYGLGTYKLNVSALDADNDRADDALGSSASRTVVVSDDDTTPPLIVLDGSTGSETDGADQVFIWDVTDAGSGVDSVTVTITRNGSIIHTSSDASGSFDFNTYGLGTYTLAVSASDADSDHAFDSLASADTRTVTVSDDDTIAPSIFVEGSTGNETDAQAQSFDWNVSDLGSGLGGLTVTITRDGAVIYNTTNLDDAAGSFDFDSFGLGTYELSISANDLDNDRAGDALSSIASRKVVVSDDDITPPNITLDGSTGAQTDGQDQLFIWNVTDAGSGIGSVSVSITKNGVEIFTSTDASGSFDFNSLGLGTYAINVSATDADNDRPNDSVSSSASRSVTVTDDDVTPPLIVLGGSTGSEHDGQNQTFTWNVTDAGSGIGSVSVSITQNGVEIYNASAPAGSFDFNSYGLGAFAMTVTATDADNDRAGDSLSISNARSVTVSDDDSTPPSVILSGSSGTETDGQNQLFAWNASDANSGLSSFSITITRDDGSGPVVIYNSNSLATNAGNFDFNGYGLGTYTMTVSATDADNDRVGDSLTTVCSRTVTVSDDDTVAPLIILGGSVGTESHALTQSFNWNASDASGLSAVAVSITKDGVVILSSNNASGNFNFDAYGIGTFVITVSASDADNDRAGDSMGGSSTRQVIVNNNAPLARPAADQTINEGSSASFNAGSSTDPDGDALNFHWDFGDGTFGVGMAPVHTYADNGDYTIIVTVTDIFGATSTAASKVHVLNVNPTGNVNSPATCLEGQNVGLTMGVSDPGADTFTYLWHVVSNNGQTIADSTSDTFNFVPNDEGTYTVTLTVTDDDGGIGIANKQVIVSNVAPKATNTGPQAAKQYSDAIIPITINATDPGAADILTASIVGGLPANSGLALNWNSTTRTGSLFGKANLAPGNYNIDVRISDNDGGFVDTFIPLVVTQEDALVTYSGVAYVSTPSVSSSTAVVTLRATIQDITAAYPGLDADAGDIRNATVTFINRDTGAVIAANIPVTLLNSGDTKTGVATYDWTVNIGSADSQSLTVGIIVNNYYTRNSALDNTVITVSKPLDSFISGGGYFSNKSSGGFLAGELGLRTNFGFNVKFNKSGTSLQGNVNIIVRSYNLPSGIRDTKLHVYQIKSTAISSLSISTDALGIRHSTFVAKANVQDITDPLNPFSVAGGLSLEMTVTDAGEPGSNAAPTDSIGFTLWNGRTLIYSSDWTGTRTIEDILEGGNIQVHDQPSTIVKK